MLIRGARLLDPSTGIDQVGDLFVEAGKLAYCPDRLPPNTRIMEAKGWCAAPGFIDVHVHLRQPASQPAETIEAGAAAAAAGGFTGIVAMPNTEPPVDSPEWVHYVLAAGRAAGAAEVMTTACLTQGRKGEAVAPLTALAEAGAVAFTDDGCTVQSDEVMRAAMREAATLGIPVMDHAQDRTIELQGGVMHEGARSRALGVPGIPAMAEIRIVERDIQLAEETGCVLHIQHVSCGASVDMIRDAQARGVRVTGEATPHHLWFCDEDIDPGRPDQYKMNPPLRTHADRARIRQGVLEGTLSILATDHAPHAMAAKAKGFLQAPFGIVGLETAVGATHGLLVHEHGMRVMDWVRAWTTHPAALLGRPAPSLQPGAPADLVVLDLDAEWEVDADRFRSLGRNTPFNGLRLIGRAVMTFRAGRQIFPLT